MKKQKQCPECGSFKLQSDGTILAAFGIGLSSFGSCITMVLFFPLMPFVMLAGIVLLIASPFVPKRYKCMGCGYSIKGEIC